MSNTFVILRELPPKTRRFYPSTVIGVFCTVAILIIFIVSLGVCIPMIMQVKTYIRLGIYMFIGSMFCMALVISYLTWLVFFKHQYRGLPNILVFLYLLLEVVIICIAWNLELDSLHYWTLFGINCVLFGILFLYTCALSKSFFDWKERVAIWEMRCIEMRIERFDQKGPCIHIPLQGPLPDYLKDETSTISNFDSEATISTSGIEADKESTETESKPEPSTTSSSRPSNPPPDRGSRDKPRSSTTRESQAKTNPRSSTSSSTRDDEDNPGPSTSAKPTKREKKIRWKK